MEALGWICPLRRLPRITIVLSWSEHRKGGGANGYAKTRAFREAKSPPSTESYRDFSKASAGNRCLGSGHRNLLPLTRP